MATDEIRSRSQLELGPDDAGRACLGRGICRRPLSKNPGATSASARRLVVMAPDGGDHVETASPWLDALFGYRINHREAVQHVVPYVWLHVDAETDRVLTVASTWPAIPANIPDRRSRAGVRVRPPQA